MQHAPSQLPNLCAAGETSIKATSMFAFARNLEMTVLGAQGRSSPKSSPSATGSAHSHAAPVSPAAASTVQQTHLPDTDLAEIRVSMEDMPDNIQHRLSAPVRSSHSSTENGQMVDILLTDSPKARQEVRK